MSTIVVYQRDGQDAYIGDTVAHESPLEPGVYHIPSGAVETAPPVYGALEIPVWNGLIWAVTPDRRGETWYETDATPVTIENVGDPILEGRVETAPDNSNQTWDGMQWVDNPPTNLDVNFELARRQALDFAFQGEVYQADSFSKLSIDSAGTQARTALEDGTEDAVTFLWNDYTEAFYWRNKANVNINMSAQTMADFQHDLTSRDIKLAQRAHVLKDTPGGIPADYTDDSHWII